MMSENSARSLCQNISTLVKKKMKSTFETFAIKPRLRKFEAIRIGFFG